MRLSTIGWMGFCAFLVVYTYVKYAADAPSDFSMGYVQSVAILVLLTGLAPGLLCYLILKILFGGAATGAAKIITGIAVGIALCVAGYAGFYYLFLYGVVPDADLATVSIRGVRWGILEGSLAIIMSYRQSYE